MHEENGQVLILKKSYRRRDEYLTDEHTHHTLKSYHTPHTTHSKATTHPTIL